MRVIGSGGIIFGATISAYDFRGWMFANVGDSSQKAKRNTLVKKYAIELKTKSIAEAMISVAIRSLRLSDRPAAAAKFPQLSLLIHEFMRIKIDDLLFLRFVKR